MNPADPSKTIRRIFDLLPYIRDRFNLPVAFGSRRSGNLETVSTKIYLENSDLVSYYLLSLGIKKGDRVITISNNRPEFNMVDMGVLQLGAIHVPVSPSITDQKLLGIIGECEARLVFLSGLSVLKRIESIREQLPHLQQLISFDQESSCTGFTECLEEGRLHADADHLQSLRDQVSPDDPATIIYISGATTELKGVVLTHRNQVSNLMGYASNPHFRQINHAYSLLPLAHSFERIINYCQQYFGMTIWYNEKIPGMSRDFREIKPEMTVMVPLLIDRLFTNLEQQTLKKPIIKLLFGRALKIIKKADYSNRKSFSLMLALLVTRIFVFPSWQKALGGRLKFILCGGAALDKRWLNLSHAAGFPIYEGYGITEAGPLVSYNTRQHNSKGSVGRLMQGVQVKIAPDGEVLVKSAGISPGYYRKSTAFTDVEAGPDWLHTGDLGSLDKEGYLTLTGIKKRIFKLSSGIYVDPLSIEKQLEQSPFISKAWVWGHNMPFLSAMIVPGYSHLSNSDADSENQPGVNKDELIGEAVKQYNNTCKGPDQVVKYAILPELEAGTVFPTGELNRQKLYEVYQAAVRSLYS